MAFIMRAVLLSATAVLIASGIGSVPAMAQATGQQGAPPVPAAAPAPVAPTITQIVASGGSDTKAMTAAIRAIVAKDPKSAQQVVDAAAGAPPEVVAALAQMLSSIQRGMKNGDPAGAQQIAAVVGTAPPAFQASYALALDSGSSNSANNNSNSAANPAGNQGNNTQGSGNNSQSQGQQSAENTQGQSNTGSGSNGGTGDQGGTGTGGFGGAGGGSVISPK